MKNQLCTLTAVLVLVLCAEANAQGTAFTYQGNLQFSGQPANGNYDFEFALFDAVAAGNQLGTTQTVNSVAVTNGAFSVSLDFGAQFPGASRFIEIRVRPAGGGAFTPLAPRQSVASSPYAIRSASASAADTATNATNAVNATNATTAATATNALSLGGVAANQYVLTGDARLSDARPPTAGSANYIQNQNAAPQASTNFNISGDGTAGGTFSGGIVNATTQFNIGGARIFSSPGNDNLFAGIGAGAANPTGAFNSFFGNGAGTANSTGGGNSFFGLSAGLGNTIGFSNSFFGRSAGDTNTSGSNNSFFGMYAGTANQTGNFNSFFGAYANPGANNLSNATAIGYRARVNQSDSLVLGSINGINGATADTKVGIGTTTPTERLHVVGNTLMTGNLTLNGTLNATLPAGSPTYIQNSTTPQSSSNFNITGNGTVGGTLRGDIVSATTQFNISGARVLFADLLISPGNTFVGISTGPDTTGDRNSFFGRLAGLNNTEGSLNSFFGRGAGLTNTTGNQNTFVGVEATFDTSPGGDRNTLLGTFTRVASGLNNATAIGARATVTQSNSLVLGAIAGINNETMNTNVGIGTTAPSALLDIATNGGNIRFGSAGCAANTTVAIGLNGPFGNCINYTLRGTDNDVYFNRPTGGAINFREGNTSTQVVINAGGTLDVRVLGTTGGTALCRNADQEIAFCSSSLRYKKNIAPFAPGLSFVRQLRPIAYEWKTDGNKDVGFGAEDVAKIDPRFVTYNDKGEVEGIKYDRLSVAFVNAFREQQAELEAQKAKIEKQADELDTLKRYICSRDADAPFCKEKK